MYPPKKPKNLEQRPREHLLFEEFERMIESIQESSDRTQENKKNRNSLLIMLMYLHGLRVSEVAALRWNQIFFQNQTLWIERRGGGIDSKHQIGDSEYQLFCQLLESAPQSVWCWRRGPESPNYIFDLKPRTIHYIIDWAGKLAKLPFPVHPQMLRHGCGYYLATKLKDPVAVQQYLGLKSPQSVMRYFGHSPASLENL